MYELVHGLRVWTTIDRLRVHRMKIKSAKPSYMVMMEAADFTTGRRHTIGSRDQSTTSSFCGTGLLPSFIRIPHQHAEAYHQHEGDCWWGRKDGSRKVSPVHLLTHNLQVGCCYDEWAGSMFRFIDFDQSLLVITSHQHLLTWKQMRTRWDVWTCSLITSVNNDWSITCTQNENKIS